MAKFLYNPIIIFLICCTISSAQIPVSDIEKVHHLAEQWAATIIKQNGHWNGHESVVVEDVRQFKDGDALLGYLCTVKPGGFILLSPYEELVPIKAYSCSSEFYPERTNGMAGFFKAEMRRTIDGLQKKMSAAGKLQKTCSASTLSRPSEWENLANGTFSHRAQNRGSDAPCYQSGEPLLKTAWDQSFPYNDLCPLFIINGMNQHACAGCVATAAAQIMRYWSWPPFRNDIDGKFQRYDWPNMVDWCKYDPGMKQWRDEKGQPLTQEKITAMARLCYEAGAAAGTRYGCDKSQAWIADQPGRDMLDGLRDEFYYDSHMTFKRHNVIEPVDWFTIIKKEINENRPVLYAVQNAAIGGHCLVIDGWQEMGATPIRYYHVNLGLGPFDQNVWCAIESVPYSRNYDSETMVIGIKPVGSLGAVLAGEYPAGSFPFYFMDQNASGEKANFAAGLSVQFLAGTEVVCKGNADARIAWFSSDNAKTVLYSKGNIRQGIKLAGGKIILRNKGGIRFLR